MSEERIHFRNREGLAIEGRIRRLPGTCAAIVTHPHPLYGGDMQNHVVAALVRTYQRLDFTTLRFNFRGVGRSEGGYGEGVGEKEDVRAAMDLLLSEGKTRLHLAGYSFGAWVIAHGLAGFPEAETAILVSPPAGFMDFGAMAPNRKIGLVVTGGADEIAPAAMLESLVPRWNPSAVLKVFSAVDHFYSGGIGELEAAVADYVRGSGGCAQKEGA